MMIVKINANGHKVQEISSIRYGPDVLLVDAQTSGDNAPPQVTLRDIEKLIGRYFKDDPSVFEDMFKKNIES